MMKLLGTALIATLAAPAAAAPAEAAAASTTEATAKPAKKERLICKRETEIGSLVRKKRTCLTAEGWKQALNLNQENVKKWQDVIDSSRNPN